MLPFRINKSLHNILLKVLFSVLIEIIGRKRELLPLLNLNLLPINQKAQKRMGRLRA
jgi:hypothetical protein